MDEKSHLDLDLLLERRNSAGYCVRVLSSPVSPAMHEATFQSPVSDLELENFLLKTSGGRNRTRLVESTQSAALKNLGGKLFDALFQGTVRECLRSSVFHAAKHNKSLRIRLRLDECGELARLPWELLYDTEDETFLALSDRTPVVRYLNVDQPVQPLTVTLPLRVLVVVSSPEDLVHLDVEGERAKIDEALANLTDRGMAEVHHLDHADLESLQDAFLGEEYHVLHFVGHGSFDEGSKAGALMFTDERGLSRRVSAADLAVQLQDRRSLRLVVLNACQGAAGDPGDRFSAVADTLVRRGVPAVVAMRSEISDLAAVRFATAFYRALAVGRPLDVAMAEGRKRIHGVSPLEWATPVLYLRSDTARLFDISRSALPEPARVSTPPTVRAPDPVPPAGAKSSDREDLPPFGVACEHAALGPRGLLAAACADGIRVMDLDTGRLVSQCSEIEVPEPLRVAWGPGRRYVASRHTDDRVVIWDLKTEVSVRVIRLGVRADAIAFSHDGLKLAVTAGKRILIFDPRGQVLADLSLPGQRRRRWSATTLNHIAFGHGSRSLIVADSEGVVRQINNEGRVSREWRHPEAVTAMAVAADSPDRQAPMDRFATGSADGRLRLWSFNGSCLHRSQRDGAVEQLLFSPEGSILAAASADRQLLIHDAGGVLHGRMELPGRAVGLGYHPDRTSLVTVTHEGTVERHSLQPILQNTDPSTHRTEES